MRPRCAKRGESATDSGAHVTATVAASAAPLMVLVLERARVCANVSIARSAPHTVGAAIAQLGAPPSTAT